MPKPKTPRKATLKATLLKDLREKIKKVKTTLREYERDKRALSGGRRKTLTHKQIISALNGPAQATSGK